MSLSNWIVIVIASGLVSCVLFTGLIAVQLMLGTSQSIRDEQGRIRQKDHWSPLALFVLLMAVALFIGVPVAANSTLSQPAGAFSVPPFWLYLVTAYSIGFLVNLYDLVVIDYLVIVRFRPEFLHLPNTPYYTSMRPHLEGWTRGLGIIFVLSLISALISLVLYV